MSDEKKTEKKPAAAYLAAIPSALRGTEIPVRKLRFAGVTDVPGKSVTEGLDTTGAAPNRPSWEVAFVPQLRHHVIAYTAPERETQIAFVHESAVKTWEPA